MARPGNGLCRPSRGAKPWSGARAAPTCSGLMGTGWQRSEQNLSVCWWPAPCGGSAAFTTWCPVGAPLVPRCLWSLLMASRSQRATVLCRERLQAPCEELRRRKEGLGRRVSGGLRRWSLGRGCSRAAPRTKPRGAGLRGSQRGLPAPPPPKAAGPLVGRLPQPPAPAPAPAAARQLLPSPLQASKGGSGFGLAQKHRYEEGVGRGQPPRPRPAALGGLGAGWLSRARCPELRGSPPPALSPRGGCPFDTAAGPFCAWGAGTGAG